MDVWTGLGGAWIACRVDVVGALSLCLSAEVPLAGLCTLHQSTCASLGLLLDSHASSVFHMAGLS